MLRFIYLMNLFGGVDPATRDYILDTILSNFNEVIFIDNGEIILMSSADELRSKEKSSIDEVFRRYFKC